MTAKRSARAASDVQIHQLEITLSETTPPVWRRLRVSDDISLHSLHAIIQHAMGWTDSHLYRFAVEQRLYCDPDPDDWNDEPPGDTRQTRLRDLGLGQGSGFSYLYDFGDHWDHHVLVEAVFAPLADETYPCCIDGARACPPRIAVASYTRICRRTARPQHPEHAECSAWARPISIPGLRPRGDHHVASGRAAKNRAHPGSQAVGVLADTQRRPCVRRRGGCEIAASRCCYAVTRQANHLRDRAHGMHAVPLRVDSTATGSSASQRKGPHRFCYSPTPQNGPAPHARASGIRRKPPSRDRRCDSQSFKSARYRAADGVAS